jgi:DNA-binding transcriptional LysR family regulator
MDVTEAFKSIELSDLRYFIAVVEAGSVTSAAEKLAIAQPYLSRKIAGLEKKLGKIELFDRHKRPHQLNQAGQAFLVKAQAIVKQVAEAVDSTKSIRLGELEGKLGYLTVGFTSSMANGILPDILRTFRQNYPNVSLILSEENSVNQIQRLRDRATDLMFLYQNRELDEAQDLEVMPLRQELLVVVLPEHHPLATKSEISLIALQKEDFIMPDRQIVPGLFGQIHHLCGQAGFEPKISLEAVFMVTILGLVAGGIGIGILPDSVQKLHRQGVVYRPISEQIAVNRLHLVWRSQDRSPIVHNFIDILHKNLSLPQ